MSDFSMNKVQVAVTMESYAKHYNGDDIEEHRETVQMYLPPEEIEFTEVTSFKAMMERKTPLELRKLKLIKLENEEIKLLNIQKQYRNGKIKEKDLTEEQLE